MESCGFTSWIPKKKSSQLFYFILRNENYHLLIKLSLCCRFRNPSTKVTTWVMVGWTKVNDLSHSNSVGREVVHITIHPHYGGFNHHHDIAILRLGVPLELSPRILPACLVFEHELYYIKNVLVSGWGKLDESKYHELNSLKA